MNIVPFVKRIEAAYEDLGFELGWRFLYGSASTLGPSTKLMFVGNNPGGDTYEAPTVSIEEGNAYRNEWWSAGRLGQEVRLLFNRIAEHLEPQIEGDALMDATLVANFCPFRSKNWNKFPKEKKKQALEFSHNLWFDISQHLKPAVLICMGNLSFYHFREVFFKRGFQINSSVRKATGWGNYEYTLESLSLGSNELMILRLPHLAQFRIISSNKCQAQSDEMIKTVANRLNKIN
ncbi:MAG: hypothetical protein KDI79_01470 [Anaerolineae bacterium]|nr:hypothetical protein [Anaerolineae bacterium]